MKDRDEEQDEPTCQHEQEDDSMLAQYFGAITWQKTALVVVVLASILICCGINGERPEFWEWLGVERS